MGDRKHRIFRSTLFAEKPKWLAVPLTAEDGMIKVV
jgi:hypothetical protein